MKHTRFISKWLESHEVDPYLDSFGRDLVAWSIVTAAGNRGFFVTVRYTQEFGYGMTTDQIEERSTGWVDQDNAAHTAPGTPKAVPVINTQE